MFRGQWYEYHRLEQAISMYRCWGSSGVSPRPVPQGKDLGYDHLIPKNLVLILLFGS